MKQTIKYDKGDCQKAIDDIKHYLGDKYETMAGHLKQSETKPQFIFYCGMIGIGGFPVVCWYNHLMDDTMTEDEHNKIVESGQIINKTG